MRSFLALVVGAVAGLVGGYALWGAPGRGQAVRLDLLEGRPVRVGRVVDGDTIVLENGLHVRYIGADSPEIYRFTKDPQPFAPEASKANAELVEGREVRLEFEDEKIDRHGRVLAHVYVEAGEPPGEVSVEESLIRSGLATATHIRPNVRLYRRFRAIEEEARAADAGLWSQSPGSHGSVDDPSAPFVASSRSTVFHKADCPAAKKISPANLLHYKTKAAARASGRKGCQLCMPGESSRPPAQPDPPGPTVPGAE